jgi:hypothetical protein
MRPLVPLMVATLLGCGDPSFEPAVGGKADDPGASASAAELRCLVADVVDGGALAGDLRAVFDVDRVGLFTAEAAATVVRVAPSLGVAELGHRRFRRADGDEIAALPGDEAGRRVYEVARADERYAVRVFEDSGLGILSHVTHGAAAGHLATLDCRPGAAAPNHDDAEPVASCAGTLFEGGYCRYRTGHFAAAVCCRASCEVAIVDDETLLGEALGARYAIDLEGTPRFDDEATQVAIDLTRDGAWQLGHARYSGAAGDRLARQPGLESYYQRFLIDTAGGLGLEIRIFDTSRLGVVLVKEDGDAAGRVFSRLDCRERPRAP